MSFVRPATHRVASRLPHQIGSSFRLVGVFENRFGRLTILPMVQMLGHMSHEQLAFLEGAVALLLDRLLHAGTYPVDVLDDEDILRRAFQLV